MKKAVWFLSGIVILSSCANQSDIAQYNDDGIYSVSSKNKKSAGTDAVYFVDEQGTQSVAQDQSSADYGYRQTTSTENGEDYAAKSNYDDYSMDEAYGRYRYANNPVQAIPGYGMRMSLGARSMYGGMAYGFSPYAGGFGFYDPFYDPFFSPYGNGFYSGFYLSGRMYSPYAFYNPWGYGFGGGFYDPFYSGFYNPYGFGYNPYYLYCPPYQSGFYGDNNIYTGPRPAVSGGSVTSDGITTTSRPGGGIRTVSGDVVNVDKISPNRADGDVTRGGIIRARDNDGYSPVIDRTPKTPIRDENNRGDINRIPTQPVVPDDNRIRDNVRTPQPERRDRNSLFNWSGDSPSNSGTRAPSNRTPSSSPDFRSPRNNSPSSPSRSPGNFNSSPRPSAPSSPSGGGSRGGGGGMRR